MGINNEQSLIWLLIIVCGIQNCDGCGIGGHLTGREIGKDGCDEGRGVESHPKPY